MNVASMNQQAIAGAEALKAGTVDNKTRKSEEVSAMQNTKVDSVELSDSAVELSNEADTETGFKGNSGTNQGQEQASADASLINILA